MKHALIALFALFSAASASAAGFELYSKAENVECTLVGTTITKKVSFYNGLAGFMSTKEIQPFGVDSFVRKAIEKSRGIRASSLGYLFLLKVDGTNYGLNIEDSDEALFFISFMQKACAN